MSNGRVTPPVTPPEVEVGSRSRNTASTTTNGSEGRGGGGENGFEEFSQKLHQRGVNASLSSLVEVCSLEAIARTIAWWDEQQSNERPPGPGVLVEIIRRGGIVERSAPKSMLAQQHAYGDQIRDWLTEHFPDLVDPREGPHPAAIAAVIRLHYKHGKGRLTKREHGPEIRAAVKAWHEKWGLPETVTATPPTERA